MGFLDLFSSNKQIDFLKSELAEASSYGGVYSPIHVVSFDGEKNTGELGVLTKYDLDYNGLRLRSWESYLGSEITQTVVRKYVTWIIGSGLKLQSEPIGDILLDEGVDIDSQKFSKKVEQRFKLYTKSKESDYSKIDNINRLSRVIYTNAIVGGDVLVIQRIINGNLNVQLVDGAHVMTPCFDNHEADAIKRGNIIKNGIEENKKGEHVAYYVANKEGESTRIEAKGKKTGRDTAYLVYGLRYRIDDNRGIPLISTVLETLKKLDRYKEATVGSAEERAKIPFFIEHEKESTGENPLIGSMAKAFNVDSEQDIPVDINGQQLADNIAATMNKQVYNMPQSSTLKSLDSKNDIYFKDFYSVNVNSICAAIGIPPEVALSKYDSNFSASRAALKDWEHTINVEREGFSFQFYQKVYKGWLELEILKNKIQAPGYLIGLSDENYMLIGAYTNARFVGNNVPHIDPLKEVQAERLKLGSRGAHIPLTTTESSTELLGGGDSDSNITQFGEELKHTEQNGIEMVEPIPETVETTETQKTNE